MLHILLRNRSVQNSHHVEADVVQLRLATASSSKPYSLNTIDRNLQLRSPRSKNITVRSLRYSSLNSWLSSLLVAFDMNGNLKLRGSAQRSHMLQLKFLSFQPHRSFVTRVGAYIKCNTSPAWWGWFLGVVKASGVINLRGEHIFKPNKKVHELPSESCWYECCRSLFSE